MTTKPITAAEAVSQSCWNRSEIEKSERCACFRCYAQFAPKEIVLWTDFDAPNDDIPEAKRPDSNTVKGNTAICPYCECDSIIGSASGAMLSDEFLKQCFAEWERINRPRRKPPQLPTWLSFVLFFVLLFLGIFFAHIRDFFDLPEWAHAAGLGLAAISICLGTWLVTGKLKHPPSSS